MPIEVGEADFEREVLQAKHPVLVAFLATWSQPCHIADAALNEVMAACPESVKVVKVNADNNPDLSIWYGIESIPTLLIFVNGNVHATIIGTATKEAILAKLAPFSHGNQAANPISHENPKYE